MLYEFFTSLPSPHLFMACSILSWFAFMAPSPVILTRYFMFAVLGVVNMPCTTSFLDGECPQSPSFQSSQVWTCHLRSFTYSAWKYEWRPVLALEMSFNANGIKRGPPDILWVRVEYKLLVSTRVKGFLLKLPNPAASVSSHSCKYNYMLEAFFPQRSCLFLW